MVQIQSEKGLLDAPMDVRGVTGMKVVAATALSCAVALAAGVSWAVLGRGGGTALMQVQISGGGHQQVAGGKGGALYPGEMLSINVPASQLATSSIGEEVKGSVPAADGGKVDFVGKIAAGTSLCMGCPVGAVTVQVVSDKYVAPGTHILGSVAGKPFEGTVVNAASDQERLSGMEKRLSTLERPAAKQLTDLTRRLGGMESRLSRLEGGKSIKERVSDLQDRINHLKFESTGMDYSLIKDNPQGFHFHGNIGPNTLNPHLDDIEHGISKIEQQPGPDEAIDPVRHRLNDVERKIETLGGLGEPRHEVTKLEKRILQVEKEAATNCGIDDVAAGRGCK